MPLPEAMLTAAKKQQGEKIRELIQRKCDEINEQIEALGQLHEYTSPPVPHVYQGTPFNETCPNAPQKKLPGLFCKLFKSCIAKVEAANLHAHERYIAEIKDWDSRKAAHERQEVKRQQQVALLNSGDWPVIEVHFSEVLQDIAWPRETLVAFDMPTPGAFAIDVDLPEIEDMPNKTGFAPVLPDTASHQG